MFFYICRLIKIIINIFTKIQLNKYKMNYSNLPNVLSEQDNGKSQCQTLPSSPLELELQKELDDIESNFGKMQYQYMKIIKEMKNSLAQRSKKSVILNNQLSNLRQLFKDHQLQIQTLMKDCETKEEQYIPKSNPKINTSPGIIQKSIDAVRKSQKNNAFKPLLNPMKHNDNNMNISIAVEPKKLLNQKKAYSPTYADQKKNLNISVVPQRFKKQKQLRQQQARENQQKLKAQKQQKNLKNDQTQKNKQIQKQKQIKLKSNEKNLIQSQQIQKGKKDLKQFLFTSLKNMNGSKQNNGSPTNKIKTNNSPKRILKKSPQNISSTNNLTKKQSTKSNKLGNLKQEMIQIF